MATVCYTQECFPEKNADRLFFGGFIAEPRHEACQGKFTQPGVLGGWMCPCPCHRASEVNPTAGPVLVTYPPESSACANPPGPFPPTSTTTTAPPELPPTR